MIVRSLMFMCFAVLGYAQTKFEPGDWTSYRDSRYALSMDAGSHNLFIATSGGILEYDLYRQVWRDPIVIGYGASSSVPIINPVLLFFDQELQLLWVATRSELLQYNLMSELWRSMSGGWAPGERVVDIGVNTDELFVETVPDKLYPRLFRVQDPIPDPEAYRYVTRYKGSRHSGTLMIDLSPKEPEGVRWRGLRTREPLNPADMYGVIGLPPANFPPLILPAPYVWESDGTVLDGALRGAPITDWIIDGFGYFWSSHWGAGVIKSDLRVTRGVPYFLGPAGNDVRAIWASKDNVWLGGFNAGERTGISHASYNLLEWNRFESRDDSRLRSTDISDIVDLGDEVWFATRDGLSAFQEKSRRWVHFNVSDGLYANEVTALAATQTELWIGTERGLSVMNLKEREITRVANPGIELAGVTDLATCRDTMYVATPNGLFEGSVDSRSFNYRALDPGLLSAPVLELSVTGAEVWLATSEGIMRYNQNSGDSESWYAADWMDESTPSCIHAMDTRVWVGTQSSGFFRFRKDTREWIQYSADDGLVDNRVQVIRSLGEDLLIGTADGLTRFWWNRPGRTK